MCAYFFATKRTPVEVQPEISELTRKVINETIVDLIHKGQTQPSDKFDLKNQTHLNIIKNCTKAAKEKREDLIAADKEAATFFALAVGAHFFLPFSWIISPLSFMYVGYLIHERIPAYQEHHQALKELRNCAKWALGDDATDKEMNHTDIQDMLQVLRENMTLEQLDKVIKDGKNENNFFLDKMIDEKTVQVETNKEDLYNKLFDSRTHKRTPLGDDMYKKSIEKQKNSIGYRVYGLDQDGSLTQITKRILGYFQQLANDAVSYAISFASSPRV